MIHSVTSHGAYAGHVAGHSLPGVAER
jgi:hypothetical protein